MILLAGGFCPRLFLSKPAAGNPQEPVAKPDLTTQLREA
jgi:hypothetical protein